MLAPEVSVADENSVGWLNEVVTVLMVSAAPLVLLIVNEPAASVWPGTPLPLPIDVIVTWPLAVGVGVGVGIGPDGAAEQASNGCEQTFFRHC